MRRAPRRTPRRRKIHVARSGPRAGISLSSFSCSPRGGSHGISPHGCFWKEGGGWGFQAATWRDLNGPLSFVEPHRGAASLVPPSMRITSRRFSSSVSAIGGWMDEEGWRWRPLAVRVAAAGIAPSQGRRDPTPGSGSAWPRRPSRMPVR
ncbi:hypothetical protein NL676_003026 [Syzygium grande]|nr:hypothetical protein NL676_003026 [Syzygium grande]